MIKDAAIQLRATRLYLKVIASTLALHKGPKRDQEAYPPEPKPFLEDVGEAVQNWIDENHQKENPLLIDYYCRLHRWMIQSVCDSHEEQFGTPGADES